MVPATITVMVPAYNEAVDIANTIEGLLKQSRIPDQILVIDDCSTDGTGDIARKYPVEVRQPPSNCGSKAIAQNWGMQFVTGDLVLPVDGDTILSPDYIEKIIPYFEEDDNLSVAAGCVLTQKTSSVWEQGRMMEYLFGFHWYRIIQNWYDSPTVCSGCCTVFRTKWVEEFGGFPREPWWRISISPGASRLWDERLSTYLTLLRMPLNPAAVSSYVSSSIGGNLVGSRTSVFTGRTYSRAKRC